MAKSSLNKTGDGLTIPSTEYDISNLRRVDAKESTFPVAVVSPDLEK